MNYSINDVKDKANYCLNCKMKPCSNKGCPLNNDIPVFIDLFKKGEYEKAYDAITNKNVLPSICGRICPHTKQCQSSCVRLVKGKSVSIGEIEAFIGDLAIENNYKIKKFDNQDLLNKRIAVIGSGPAGLTASAFLARRGANVTIYEKYDSLGGILVRGIPEFRLPKKIVEDSIGKILELGINVKLNCKLGVDFELLDLKKEFDIVVLAIGANVSNKLDIDGQDLNGVYGGNEFLEGVYNIDLKDKIVAVNGGGNVAIDAARMAKYKGAKKVYVIYRRSKNQMPAEVKEFEDAINDNVEFLFQNNIVKIIGDLNHNVSSLELIKTKLVKKDDEKRLSPVNILDSNYKICVDYVIMALGSHCSDVVKKIGVEVDSTGRIIVDEFGKTSIPDVYAIGDLAGNIATVAYAAKSGRDLF